jgi:DNA-directed RNA polymerase specialized sigma24 family protein
MTRLITRVELVRLYSNPQGKPETLLQLRERATSSLRPRDRRISRQSQVRLDAQQARSLAIDYTEGKTITELARRFGIHRATVTALLHRQGVELRRAGLEAEDVTAATHLYVQGWSLAKLGATFGVDSTTVWRALRAAGVVTRPPGHGPASHSAATTR